MFIKLTGATDGRDIILVPSRIVLCERKEGSTRVVYRMQGVGTPEKDYSMIWVSQTVDEIYSLIHDKL